VRTFSCGAKIAWLTVCAVSYDANEFGFGVTLMFRFLSHGEKNPIGGRTQLNRSPAGTERFITTNLSFSSLKMGSGYFHFTETKGRTPFFRDDFSGKEKKT